MLATRGIANKGFSGMRKVLARFNISCNLIGNHPLSLTGHTANVTANAKKRQSNKILQTNQVMTMKFLNQYI